MKTTLLKFVAANVARHRGPMTDLARDAGVSYGWLRLFAQGKIPNPGVRQVEKLAEHFAAKQPAATRKSRSVQ